MSHTGKIARLPRDVRDELNLRMENGEEGPVLLEWLNGLPKTREVLGSQFGGAPVTKQNLSEWRQGGHREWVIFRDCKAGVEELSDQAQSITESADAPALACALAASLGARYARVLTSWDGEPEHKIEAKLRMLKGLCRDIALLQRTLNLATRQQSEFHRDLEEAHQADIKNANQMARERAMAPLLAKLSEGQTAEGFGGGDSGLLAAKYFNAIRYDLPLPNIARPLSLGSGETAPPDPVKPGQT